jgi:hypothetical protein
MVAPERIATGREAVPEFSPVPGIMRPAAWLTQSWRHLRLGWEAVHYTWKHWVLQYSAERQEQMMAGIGLGKWTWQGLTMALVVLLSGMLAVLAFRLFRQPLPRDRVVLAYQRFCSKLARRGMVRHAYEGPFAFARRVKDWRPELSVPVDRITHLYGALRYGRQSNAPDVQRLRDAVRLFRP